MHIRSLKSSVRSKEQISFLSNHFIIHSVMWQAPEILKGYEYGSEAGKKQTNINEEKSKHK